MLRGTASVTKGVSPTINSTSALSGTKSNKEKTISEATAPAPNCRTTLHFTWCRHSQARQPLAAIWMTPWNTMAIGTGSSTSRKPISSMPPAMPKIPEMNEVTTATTASANRTSRENIEARRSARGRSCRGSDKVDACPQIFSSCRP